MPTRRQAGARGPHAGVKGRRCMQAGQRPEGGSARGTTSGLGSLRFLFRLELAIILVALAVILGLTLFFAQYSGILRWLLFVVILLIGAWMAARFVRLRTVETEPLGSQVFPPQLVQGDLKDLSTSLRRGSRGLRYSQLHFAVNLRDAFLAKLRASSGFLGTVQELNADIPLLRALCGDKELFRFLRRATVLERTMAEVLSSTEELFPGEASEFPQLMEDLLARMEAWS